MKFVGMIGTNAKKSTNRQLVTYMQQAFADLAEIEILEIDQVPMFNETEDQTNSEVIQTLNQKNFGCRWRDYRDTRTQSFHSIRTKKCLRVVVLQSTPV